MRNFIADIRVKDRLIVSDKEEIYHISKVIRLQKGDNISLLFENTSFDCVIVSVSENEIEAEIISETVKDSRDFSIDIIISAIKPKKLEELISSTVAFRINTYIITNTSRTQISLDKYRRERFDRIIKSAVKQSKVSSYPNLEIKRFDSIDFGAYTNLIVSNERENVKLKLDNKKGKFALLLGPEGGFTEDELSYLDSLDNSVNMTLGEGILRAESAGVAATTLILRELGEI